MMTAHIKGYCKIIFSADYDMVDNHVVVVVRIVVVQKSAVQGYWAWVESGFVVDSTVVELRTVVEAS